MKEGRVDCAPQLAAVGASPSTFGSLADRDAPGLGRASQRRLRTAPALAFEQRLEAGLRVDRRRVILHQAAGIGRGAGIAVQRAPEHAQHRHLLAPVM